MRRILSSKYAKLINKYAKLVPVKVKYKIFVQGLPDGSTIVTGLTKGEMMDINDLEGKISEEAFHEFQDKIRKRVLNLDQSSVQKVFKDPRASEEEQRRQIEDASKQQMYQQAPEVTITTPEVQEEEAPKEVVEAPPAAAEAR